MLQEKRINQLSGACKRTLVRHLMDTCTLNKREAGAGSETVTCAFCLRCPSPVEPSCLFMHGQRREAPA